MPASRTASASSSGRYTLIFGITPTITPKGVIRSTTFRRTRCGCLLARGLPSWSMDPSTTLAVSGPLLLAAAVAVLAGAVSFASPCVVPLVPGYRAYLAGLVGADAPPATPGEAEEQRSGRFRVAGAAVLFVAGFTVVFGAILTGVVWLADPLVANEAVLQRVGGVVMIVM